MKLNTLSSFVRPFNRRTSQVAVLGCFAFAVQVACSDAPQSGTPKFTGTAGTPGTAGTAPGTAGTFASTAGTGGAFGTAGTGFETAGTAGGGAGGVGTAGAATAGTGGTPPPAMAYCKTAGHPIDPLPYTVNTGFIASQWGGGIAEVAAAECDVARAPSVVGLCNKWTWTPDAAAPAYSFVAWVTMWDSKYTHPPVCLADGAKAITFLARGAAGGELLTVAGGGAQEVTLEPLTTSWKRYSISLAGVDYNSFEAGVTQGFSWKVEPQATVSTFYIDDIQIVKDLPTDIGAGGAGGAGP